MPKAQIYKVYTAKEWRNLPAAEKQREIKNLVNNINRTMKRMEEAGLADLPGYEAVTVVANKYKTKSGKHTGTRLTKATSQMSDSEMRLYHQRLIELGGNKTFTVRRGKKYIEDLGTTSDGQVLFTLKDYTDLDPLTKATFWRQFHLLKKKLGRDRYEKGPKGTLEAYKREIVNSGKSYGQRMNMTTARIQRIMEIQNELIINSGNDDKTPPHAKGYGAPL